MEEWNIGIMEKIIGILKLAPGQLNPLFHRSIIPSFHHSSVIVLFQFFFQLALPIKVGINSTFGKKGSVVPHFHHLSLFKNDNPICSP
jgi:hypothetical protein